MGKPTICLGENKGADQLRSNCEQFFYLNPQFQASISFLSLYRSVCVGPGRLLVFPRGGSFVFCFGVDFLCCFTLCTFSYILSSF